MVAPLQRTRLVRWKDVIFAILLRELRSRFSDKLGFGWAIASPLIFIVAFASVRGLIDDGETHGMPTFFFIMYGLVIVQLFLTSVGAVSKAIKKNKSLFAFRQVTPLASILSIAFFELFITLLTLMLVFVMAYLMEFELVMNDPLLVVTCFLMVWLLGLAIGGLSAIFSSFIPELEKIRQLLMRPTFFLSGIFFSLKDIPSEYWYLLDWNPLLHMVELTRDAAYPAYGDQGVNLGYAAIVSLACFCVFSVVNFKLWKQAISN